MGHKLDIVKIAGEKGVAVLKGVATCKKIMSERMWNFVRDVEADYGVEIDEPPSDILCDGETCRHSECDCWDDFRSALIRQAEAMK